jgi:hypothetical protein
MAPLIQRSLRSAVVWHQVMQGTYNEKGGRWVERTRSARETCRLRGAFPFSKSW